jgi:hypothetical protein
VLTIDAQYIKNTIMKMVFFYIKALKADSNILANLSQNI